MTFQGAKFKTGIFQQIVFGLIQKVFEKKPRRKFTAAYSVDSARKIVHAFGRSLP